MPAVSSAQFRAMQAAKHGHSTLGIPAKVGAEFVAATKDAKDLPDHVRHARLKRALLNRKKPT